MSRQTCHPEVLRRIWHRFARSRRSFATTLRMTAVVLAVFVVAGCWRDDMADDAHAKPMEASSLFSDGKLARPLINGTVPRGHRTINDPIYAVTNAPPGTEKANFKFQLTPGDLEIGRQHYTPGNAAEERAIDDLVTGRAGRAAPTATTEEVPWTE